MLDETLEKNKLGEHGMILDVVMISGNVIYNFEDSKVLDKASLNKIIAYNGKLFIRIKSRRRIPRFK